MHKFNKICRYGYGELAKKLLKTRICTFANEGFSRITSEEWFREYNIIGPHSTIGTIAAVSNYPWKITSQMVQAKVVTQARRTLHSTLAPYKAVGQYLKNGN